MRRDSVTHEFVVYIPDDLTEGTVYVSILYATIVHRCLCGCGNQVVTPLAPTDWAMTFDGDTISLNPSIGNWSFPCQSHYWIRRNKVVWSRRWSRTQIAAGRARDQAAKHAYFEEDVKTVQAASGVGQEEARDSTLWSRLKRWLSR
jgi:hypothetical protein